MHTCIANASNGIVEITISEPGTLKEKVLDVDVDLIESLKVSGILNASDLEFLGTSTGLVANIKTLDIRDVKFVLDGQIYQKRARPLPGVVGMGSNGVDYYALWPRDSVYKTSALDGSPIYTRYGNNLGGAFCESKYEKIILPTSIYGVGDRAFRKAENLKEVVLGGNEKYIDVDAFEGAKKLSKLDLTESVDSIGSNAFKDACDGLNIDLTHIRGFGVNCFENSGVATVRLPSSDVNLPKKMFYKCPQLAEIDVPDGIKVIPEYMFGSCMNLKKVSLGKGLEEIGEYAFFKCPLPEIALPDGLKVISDAAFSGCEFTDISLPETVEEIGGSAFSCKNLANINVPKNLRKISGGAFNGSKIEAGLPVEKGISYFGTVAFQVNGNLPSHVTFRPGTTILADNLFPSDIVVESIELPLELKYIGERVFSGIKINEIILPEGLEIIYNNAFAGVPLNKITFPSTLRKIGDRAFASNELTSVSFPDGLEEIGISAFQGQPLINITLPVNLKVLGAFAFNNNDNLVRINYNCRDAKLKKEENNIGYSPFYNSSCDRINIGEEVTTIPDFLFNMGSKATVSKIQLPSGITSIGERAFALNSLVDINLPESLEILGDGAFDGVKIKAHDIPQSLKSIGRRALYETELENITLPENLEYIGIYAFAGITTLDKVVVNCSNVNAEGVFSGSSCNSLTIGKNVKIIPSYFFDNLQGYKEVEIPVGCELGVGVFSNSESLTTVRLPENITIIPDESFSGCNALMDINIPSSVEVIGYRAFVKCLNLTGLELPIKLEEIGERAFYRVPFDNGINLGPNVKKIEKEAFYNCTNVGRIFIPSQVESIGENAFNIYTDYSSDPVQVISMIEDPASVTGGMYEIFPDEYNKWKLRMPCGTEELYRSTPGWFGFGEYAVNDDLTINLTDGFETQFDNLSSVDLCGVIRDNIYYSLNYSGDMSNLYLVGNKTVDDKLFDFLTPYNYDLTQLFDGIAVQLPAGEGYLTLEYSNSGGSTLTVKVAGQDPVIFDNQNLSTNNVKFNTSEETFAYIYSNGDNSWSNVYSLKVSTNVSGVEDVIEGADEHVLQRLTVDGMPASVDSKGIVIEKLSNGQVRKVMRK